MDKLTNREKEIMDLVCEGLCNKEIATKLYISYKTVKQHIYSSYQKLGVNNRVEAVNKYMGKERENA